MKLLLFFVGILLLPVCAAVTLAAVSLVGLLQTGGTAVVPPSAWALGGGYALWLLVYFTLPRPVRTYVLAHELTHALWGWLTGARVLHMQVSKASGSVTLSKSNLLVALAPYFFPLYTVLAIAGYYATSIFLEVERYYLAWLGIVGFTWGFHFTFTVTTLMQHQSDIREYGRLFSYAVIYALNVLGICLWVVLVSSLTLDQMVQTLQDRFITVTRRCLDGVSRLSGTLQAR